jgi:hypothetical protein
MPLLNLSQSTTVSVRMLPNLSLPIWSKRWSYSLWAIGYVVKWIRNKYNERIKQQCCKIGGFHGGDYEECRLLVYRNPVLTSGNTLRLRYRGQLFMLCKIWGFHGGDYEECHLLGNINPVHTSLEKHYVSATEPSRLMLCKIWGFRGGDCEECRLVGCYILFF